MTIKRPGKFGSDYQVNNDFWKNKRVFLTGHTGFKGSWLSLWLQEMGAVVQGYALAPPTSPSLYEIADVDQGISSTIADIRDYETLCTCISEFKPEIVFHMAAQPLVRLSYEKPLETYATNVMGTVNLLEAIRHVDGIKAVVNITSDKCYENREWPWGYRENEAMGGYDPYSSSKGCAELVTSAYRQSFFNHNLYEQHGCAISSVRAGNVIGGGDWATDRLIPDLLKAFEKNLPAIIRSPQSVRPWQHVLEPLHGYLMLAEKLYNNGIYYAGGWNFGPNDEDAKPVQWIVETLAKNWGGNAAWELDNHQHPHEAHYLKLDCSKARQILGWFPVWNLNHSLERIVNWHKTWLEDRNMREYSLLEIQTYAKQKKELTE